MSMRSASAAFNMIGDAWHDHRREGFDFKVRARWVWNSLVRLCLPWARFPFLLRGRACARSITDSMIKRPVKHATLFVQAAYHLVEANFYPHCAVTGSPSYSLSPLVNRCYSSTQTNADALPFQGIGDLKQLPFQGIGDLKQPQNASHLSASHCNNNRNSKRNSVSNTIGDSSNNNITRIRHNISSNRTHAIDSYGDILYPVMPAPLERLEETTCCGRFCSLPKPIPSCAMHVARLPWTSPKRTGIGPWYLRSPP